MSRMFTGKSATTLRLLARRFRRNTTGVAAVEFAYLAPVLMLMLLGSIEISRMVSVDRRFGIVTSMTGDLIAREKTFNQAAFDGVVRSIEHVMKPYDPSTLKLRMVEVMAAADNANNTKVYMSFAHNGATAPGQCSSFALPTEGLVGQGGFAVVIETTYQYTPIFADFLTGPLNWTDRSTHSPRNSCVDTDNRNCVLACP